MINVDLIKEFEGFESKPYPDPATKKAPYTIGYGTTFYPDGKKVTMKDPAISEAKATELLAWYVTKVVQPTLDKFVKKPLNQNQKDALASFIYNIGEPNFSSSTMLKKINVNPNDPTIELEFAKWNKAAGKVMNGLTKRRSAEAQLYKKPIK